MVTSCKSDQNINQEILKSHAHIDIGIQVPLLILTLMEKNFRKSMF